MTIENGKTSNSRRGVGILSCYIIYALWSQNINPVAK